MRLFLLTVAPLVALRLLTLGALRVYRISSRHTGLRDIAVIGLSTLISSLLFICYVYLSGMDSFPRSVVITDWFLNFYAIVGLRVAYRILVDERPAYLVPHRDRKERRILVVGAGARGASLAREIRRRPAEGLHLVGFLDDNPSKRTMLLHGVPVLGSTHDIRRLVQEQAIDEVIFAIPSATGACIRDIMVRCEDLPVRVRISPGFSELNSQDHLHALRDVSVDDLLGREPVSIDMKEIAAYLAGERVLVTGAGGSIGSELVRQIIPVKPAELLLLGRGEGSIFEIEQELIHKFGVNPTCLIADIREYDRLRRLMEQHRPTVIFHAAAHKHVPLMEQHPVEAITTNVQGTRNLARLATQIGVRRFVMISTDKAVNPTSVMGASKRAAELIVQAESRRSATDFVAVRFGNVLGSRGSVIPLMRKQIEVGGPVRVTHPDMVRYFMTIPEAAQLVIQAGALGGRGTLYMLDMGEPVRILDLAADLIRLSGLVPGKDIAIEITGPRPGEKLREELLTAEEGASLTRHERIFVAAPAVLAVDDLDYNVDALIKAANTGDVPELLRLLKVLEPAYGPPVGENLPVYGIVPAHSRNGAHETTTL